MDRLIKLLVYQLERISPFITNLRKHMNSLQRLRRPVMSDDPNKNVGIATSPEFVKISKKKKRIFFFAEFRPAKHKLII